MAMSSLPCIAFAYCPWELRMVPKEDLDKWQLPEDNLTLLGMVGIKVCIVVGVYFILLLSFE
jgi:Ca2+-transporting ATPase